MKRLIAVSVMVWTCTSVTLCEEVLREISWAKQQQAGELPGGEVVASPASQPAEQLKVDNPDAAARAVTVLVIDTPGISKSKYALIGEVRYEGVQGRGYLEMWSQFPKGGRYFSRTLATRGVLKGLEGSSGWRPFSLPFFMNDGSSLPNSLTVNVVFPGKGTVYLSPLRLVQYTDNENLLAVTGAWWDNRTGGLIGGILGATLGCIGGLVGILAGMRKARRFVVGLTWMTIVFGVVMLFCLSWTLSVIDVLEFGTTSTGERYVQTKASYARAEGGDHSSSLGREGAGLGSVRRTRHPSQPVLQLAEATFRERLGGLRAAA